MPFEKNIKNSFIIIALLLTITFLLNIYTTAHEADTNFYHSINLIRPMIFISIFTAWALSFKQRILHQQVRRYMTTICYFAVLLMIIRCIKYYFVIDWAIERQLWYLYYLPLIFIPVMVLFISVALDQNEHYRMPKWTQFCFIPAILLLLTVMSNDLHQFVFSFEDITNPANEYFYQHNAGYYAIFIWIFLCFLSAYIIMIYKSRKKKSQFCLPLLPYTLMILAIILDFTGLWPAFIYYDICVIMTLFPILALECCIQTGLIASNTGYESLFMAGNFGAQIYDTQNNLYLRSVNAKPLDMNTLILDDEDAFLYDKKTIVKKSTISGGSVLWQEDISEIAALLERLEDNRLMLKENMLIEEEICRIKRQISSLKERNRIFDILTKENADIFDKMNTLLHSIKSEKNTRIIKNELEKILLTGTYLKRRGNLILIREKNNVASMEELILSLEEIANGLKMKGIDCGITLSGLIQFPPEDLIKLLDFVWQYLEIHLTDLSAFHITENRVNGSYELRLFMMLSIKKKGTFSDKIDSEEAMLQFKQRIPDPEVKP